MNKLRGLDNKGFSLLLILLSIAFFSSAEANTFTADYAYVKFHSKKPDKDTFIIRCRFEGLTLDAVDSVTFQFGTFEEKILKNSFEKKKDKYIYRGKKEKSGISKMVIDFGKDTITALGQKLDLSKLNNPAEIRFITGDFDKCTMPLFRKKKKKWLFNSKKDEQVFCNGPEISGVVSSVFSDDDAVYPTGRMVRIDVEESTGGADIISGTIQITSATTGYDSGVQDLTFGSIFFHWDTTGLEPADDYIVEVTLVDADGRKTTDDSLLITLTSNPPAINKLVSQADVSVPAIGIPVSVARSYLLDSGFNSSLGFGWTHSYLMHVVETGDGLVKVFNADGSGSFFISNGDGTYESPKGDFRVLTKNTDGTFYLREKVGTVFQFSAAGKLTSIEDRNSNTIMLSYDAGGLLETITDASSQETAFAYDANNRLSTITDPAGRTVSYGYDSAGDLISFTDFGGFITHYTYDTDHNLTAITDPAGRQTFFTVDSEDRLESISNADGNILRTFAYGVPEINQMTVTDALGNQTIFTYNTHALITERTDPLGNTTVNTYDEDLNLIRRTDAAGNQATFTYDPKGNTLTETDAQGNTTTTTYETQFNQIDTVTDANGNMTDFDYDANGNLTAKTYPNGKTENFSYDGHGNLSGITDANGNITTFEYNARGRLTAKNFPDGSTETYAHDAFGNINSKTDRMGQTIHYEHDVTGRLITKSYPDSSSVSFEYDPAGKLLSATDANGVFTFEYDGTGRMVTATSPGGEVVSYGYDAAGNRTRLTYPDGMVLHYAYDALNRLSQISESGQMVANYTYDSLGRVIRRQLQNGTYSTYSYDASNRLLELMNRKSTSEVISSFAYTYDNIGNRLTMTTMDGSTQYIYDETYQLTDIIYPDGSTTSYNLDPAGNRVSEVVDGNAIDYTTNELNQYTNVDGDAYTYDANGNMTSRTTSDRKTVYTYDFENRLVQVDTVMETIFYTYDPFGRRTSKTTASGTTNYVHDGFRVIMEKDNSGLTEATYVHGIGMDEVLIMKRDYENYFYSHDGLGSVVDLTNASEDIVETFSYDVFGTPSNDSIVGNHFLFTGRVFEPETGIYFYRARYYNPEIGRFITADPIGYNEGANLYLYVQNNPVNWIDPYGLNRGRRRGYYEYYRRQQTQRAREIRNLEKAIRQHDPSFRYEVLRPRDGQISQEEVENLRDVLSEHQARRRAEFYESIKPRERTRDRIRTLEDAIEQLEGISRQQKLTPERIESIQKSLDRLKHELSRLQEGGCP